MTSSLEWSKFSAMLSPDTTKEPEGEIFESFYVVYRQVLFPTLKNLIKFWEIKWKLFLVEDNWTTESTTPDQKSDLEDLYDR